MSDGAVGDAHKRAGSEWQDEAATVTPESEARICGCGNPDAHSYAAPDGQPEAWRSGGMLGTMTDPYRGSEGQPEGSEPKCRHRDSRWGRCTDCGMTWEEQAKAAPAPAPDDDPPNDLLIEDVPDAYCDDGGNIWINRRKHPTLSGVMDADSLCSPLWFSNVSPEAHADAVAERDMWQTAYDNVCVQRDQAFALRRKDKADHEAAVREAVRAHGERILAAVESIHTDGGNSQGFFGGKYGDHDHCCNECGTLGEYGIPWPCPTVLAAREAVGE